MKKIKLIWLLLNGKWIVENEEWAGAPHGIYLLIDRYMPAYRKICACISMGMQAHIIAHQAFSGRRGRKTKR